MYYEFHITVESIESLDIFKQHCNELNIKPIIIDLKDNSVLQHVMTSCTLPFYSDILALEYAEYLKVELKKRNYNCIRTKIESEPTHHLAPKTIEVMPSGCYFESHIKIDIDNEHIDTLTEYCSKHDLHKSRNAFKQNTQNRSTYMLTYRNNTIGYVIFKTSVQNKVLNLRKEFSTSTVYDPIVEFALYDTNVHLDDEWLRGE